MQDRAVGSGRHALSHWTRVGNSEAAVPVDTQTGPSAELPRSLKVAVTAAPAGAPAGVQNDGYWAWRFARKSERATVTVKMLYARYSMQQEHVDAGPAPDPYLAEALERWGTSPGQPA